MATPESLAIRRTAALDRVSAAAETIAGALGVEIAPFPDPHKRPELRPVEEAEWLCETLDAIADAVTAPKTAPKATKSPETNDKPAKGKDA